MYRFLLSVCSAASPHPIVYVVQNSCSFQGVLNLYQRIQIIGNIGWVKIDGRSTKVAKILRP